MLILRAKKRLLLALQKVNSLLLSTSPIQLYSFLSYLSSIFFISHSPSSYIHLCTDLNTKSEILSSLLSKVLQKPWRFTLTSMIILLPLIVQQGLETNAAYVVQFHLHTFSSYLYYIYSSLFQVTGCSYSKTNFSLATCCEAGINLSSPGTHQSLFISPPHLCFSYTLSLLTFSPMHNLILNFIFSN